MKITAADIEREYQRRLRNKFYYFFPESGPHRRELYSKHMGAIAATAKSREVCFMAANRVGKTELGAFVATAHATGIYPEWWTGKRFPDKVNILVAGESAKLVRDSVQRKLLGASGALGTGMIPADLIIDTRPKSGVPDAVDLVRIKHIKGESVIQFQSYDQGRVAFQSTERDMVWLDEEPPLDVYSECLIRTMTTGGLVLSTFTPLKGVSETVISLQEKEAAGRASIVRATWDDAPHLGEKEKQELWDSLPPFQRDARSKGIPQLGSGAVYPVPESELIMQPFTIPEHYKVCYGLDVGWNNTAAVWLAQDPDSDVVYVTGDYKRGQAEPSVHASAIRARGDYNGAIDPASRGRSQHDGEQLIHLYRQQGLKIQPADNAVESGIFKVYERMTTGRLRIFSTCQHVLQELRLYRRDEKGRIVKENDHCLDALRYGVVSGLPISSYAKAKKPPPMSLDVQGSWMGA